jgi:hypothetical protein
VSARDVGVETRTPSRYRAACTTLATSADSGADASGRGEGDCAGGTAGGFRARRQTGFLPSFPFPVVPAFPVLPELPVFFEAERARRSDIAAASLVERTSA